MSFGIKVGRLIGSTAALVVEGSIRGAQGLGSFGADVVTGTEVGFAEKRAAMIASREEFMAKRRAECAAQAPIVAKPAKTKAEAKAGLAAA